MTVVRGPLGRAHRIGATALAFTVVLSAAIVVAAPSTSAPMRASTGAPADAARRILIVSLPHVTWEHLEEADAPNLRALLSESGVANLAVRVERLATRSGDGYTTIGAGTRAVADSREAGLALEPDEVIENGTAADVFERRSGYPLDGAVGHMWIGSISDDNEDALFGGVPGVLGDALVADGRVTGVVANADWSIVDPEVDTFHREATAALMGSRGVVGCGRVARSLLVDDAAAAYGVRLDAKAVVDAFEKCWTDRAVVLVEASDLARAEAYRSRTGRRQGDRLFVESLERADTLIGKLLERVDHERDAVVVVAPASPQRAAHLTVFGVRAPGLEPGLLVSGSTRQAGFVTIQDVGPTIAALAGLDRPDEMEGRAATRAGSGGDAGERFEELAARDRDARFRDKMLASVVAVYIALQILLSAGIAFSLARRAPRFERLLEVSALGLLGALPLTYLSALLPFTEWGAGAYALFLVGGGAAIGIAADATRRRVLLPLGLVLCLMLGVTAVSVTLLDSRLQLSTVFGDSPIVAGRFSGVNNVTFSQMMVAAILLASFLVHRRKGRVGLVSATALLVAVLLVDTAPMWGADVGGILAGLPALALAVLLLSGRRLRPVAVVYGALATVLTVFALGMLDLTRESSERTHLGRLFERVAADGWDGFATIVERKLSSNIATLTGSAWSMMVVPMLVFGALLVWRAPARLRAVLTRIPEMRPALYALLTAGVLGYALNDSGIAVPGMMLAVANPAVSYLLLRVGAEPEPAGT